MLRDHKVDLLGQFDEKGKLMIIDKSKLTSLGSSWKTAKVIVSVEVLPEDPSGLLLGYYFKKVVQDFRRILWNAGERLTDKQVDEKIRSWSPVTIKSMCMWNEDLIDVRDLDNSKLLQHIDHLRQIAAEEFDYNIEDPKR